MPPKPVELRVAETARFPAGMALNVTRPVPSVVDPKPPIEDDVSVTFAPGAGVPAPSFTKTFTVPFAPRTTRKGSLALPAPGRFARPEMDPVRCSPVSSRATTPRARDA